MGITEQPARPSVLLTYASSLDGSIAARAGAPFAFSGHAALEMTHALRAAHDAILIGIGTVLIDNPQLNVRYAAGPNPRPVILDARLRCPPNARCVDAQRGTILVTTRDAPADAQRALENAGATVLRVASIPENPAHIDLRALLQMLAAQNIRTVMVEGGAQIITAFLQAQLVDRVILTFAPMFVGGVRGVTALTTSENHFPRLKNLNVTQLENDIIVQGDMDWNETQ
jgi:3,4-dihydroxy 2-butanone 4-phosphate synthase/GTP cyclohydrolase II